MSDGLPIVDGFVDLVEIGTGGFSVVYAATQLGLMRSVALKVINASGNEARRFEREAIAMGALSDVPSVVGALQVTATTDGRPVLVMHLLEQSLAQRLAAAGPVEHEVLLRWAGQLAQALDGAHALGIFHRDIKPANVLISRRNDAYLADFGIAALESMSASTMTAASFTPPHAPPERFDGDERPELAAAGDVYSFASTLFTALTGAPPFGTAADGGNRGLMDRVSRDPLPAIRSIPSSAHAVLSKAMAKTPGQRFQSAGEFVDAFRLAMTPTASRPSIAPPVAPAADLELDLPQWAVNPRIDEPRWATPLADAEDTPFENTPFENAAFEDTAERTDRLLDNRFADTVHRTQVAPAALPDRFAPSLDPVPERRNGYVAAAGLAVVAIAALVFALVPRDDPGDTASDRLDLITTMTARSTTTITTPPGSLRVVVGNGSGVPGRAKTTAEKLAILGYTDIAITDAAVVDTTAVFARTADFGAGTAMAAMLGIPVDRVLPIVGSLPIDDAEVVGVDIVVVVGPEFVPEAWTPRAPTTAAAVVPDS